MAMQKRKVAASFVEFIPGYGIAVGNEGETFEADDATIAELEARGKLPKVKGKAKSDTAADAVDEEGGDDATGGEESAADTGAPA